MGEVSGPSPSMLLTFTRRDSMERQDRAAGPCLLQGKGAGPKSDAQIPGLLWDLGQGATAWASVSTSVEWRCDLGDLTASR